MPIHLSDDIWCDIFVHFSRRTLTRQIEPVCAQFYFVSAQMVLSKHFMQIDEKLSNGKIGHREMADLFKGAGQRNNQMRFHLKRLKLCMHHKDFSNQLLLIENAQPFIKLPRLYPFFMVAGRCLQNLLKLLCALHGQWSQMNFFWSDRANKKELCKLLAHPSVFACPKVRMELLEGQCPWAVVNWLCNNQSSVNENNESFANCRFLILHHYAYVENERILGRELERTLMEIIKNAKKEFLSAAQCQSRSHKFVLMLAVNDNNFRMECFSITNPRTMEILCLRELHNPNELYSKQFILEKCSANELEKFREFCMHRVFNRSNAFQFNADKCTTIECVKRKSGSFRLYSDYSEQLFFDRISNPYHGSVNYFLHNAMIADINMRNEDGNTPLQIVAKNGNEQLARLLLANGADLEARTNGNCCQFHQNGNQMNALHIACASNQPNLIRLLLDRGAQVNSRDAQGFTPLHWMVQSNNPRCVELLLHKGADLNAAGRWVNDSKEIGSTILPTHAAAQSGYVDILEALFLAGADLSAVDGYGSTLLHYTAKGKVNNRDMTAMRYLLDNGFDVNAKSHAQYSPLHLAIAFDFPDAVELLVQRGVDCNAKGDWVEHVTEFWDILVKERQNGMSPLHLGAIVGNKKIVEILLANGANLEAKTEQGNSPLYYAVKERNAEVYLLLISAGANPLSIELDAHIAFLYLCLNENDVVKMSSHSFLIDLFEAILSILVKNEGNLNQSDANGLTLLHYAIKLGVKYSQYKWRYFELIKKLLQNGANVNGKNNDEGIIKSPLEMAIENNYSEAVDFLLGNGADLGQAEFEQIRHKNESAHLLDPSTSHNFIIIRSIVLGIIAAHLDI